MPSIIIDEILKCEKESQMSIKDAQKEAAEKIKSVKSENEKRFSEEIKKLASLSEEKKNEARLASEKMLAEKISEAEKLCKEKINAARGFAEADNIINSIIIG